LTKARLTPSIGVDLEAIGTPVIQRVCSQGPSLDRGHMLYTSIVPVQSFGLRQEIGRLFEDTFGRGQVGRSDWSPAADIHETARELTFVVELSGIEPEDVRVTAEDGILTIRGERAEELIDGDGLQYHLLERNYGSFMRRFQLPPGVENEMITADFQHGLLAVRIPKTALPKPTEVQITTGAADKAPATQVAGRGENRVGSKKALAGNGSK
jgi:HSP20 family protein